MAWFSLIKKFSWSDVIWTTNRTQSRLVTSVWHGGAADSAKQNQTCNVRFSTPCLAKIPFSTAFWMHSLSWCRSFIAASMWSWKSLAADIVSSFVLASTNFFQRRSHIIARSADYISQPDISMRDLQGPYMWFITGLQVHVPLVNWVFFSCLMLKDILVESHHFPMELRIV